MGASFIQFTAAELSSLFGPSSPGRRFLRPGPSSTVWTTKTRLQKFLKAGHEGCGKGHLEDGRRHFHLVPSLLGGRPKFFEAMLETIIIANILPGPPSRRRRASGIEAICQEATRSSSNRAFFFSSSFLFPFSPPTGPFNGPVLLDGRPGQYQWREMAGEYHLLPKSFKKTNPAHDSQIAERRSVPEILSRCSRNTRRWSLAATATGCTLRLARPCPVSKKSKAIPIDEVESVRSSMKPVSSSGAMS